MNIDWILPVVVEDMVVDVVVIIVVVGGSVGGSVGSKSGQIGADPVHIGFSGSYFSSVSKVSWMVCNIGNRWAA